MEDEAKKFITGKSIMWFLIAAIAMSFYYLIIDIGLMKVQGLDFFYLWSGGEAAPSGH